MLGLGAATAADKIDAVLDDKPLLPLRQLARAERVMRMAVMQLGQACIGLDRDAARPILAKQLHMLGHLLRPGRTVEAEQRHVERFDHGHRRRDIGADEQCAGGLDRHLHEDRLIPTRRLTRAFGGVDRRLDLQRILAGLDQNGVDAALDEPAALHGQRRFERVVIDMPERRQPRTRPDRADHEPRLAVDGESADRFARQFAGAAVEGVGLIGDAEFGQG